MLSTLIIGILFFLVAWAGSQLYPNWRDLTNLDAAGTEMMRKIGGPMLATVFLAIYIFGTTLCGTAAQMSVSRVLFTMGRDRVLPMVLSRLHPRFKTPYVASLLVSGLSLVSLLLTLEQAVYMINFGALVAFAAVNLAAFKYFWVDQKKKGNARPLLIPFSPLGRVCIHLLPVEFPGMVLLPRRGRLGGRRRRHPGLANQRLYQTTPTPAVRRLTAVATLGATPK